MTELKIAGNDCLGEVRMRVYRDKFYSTNYRVEIELPWKESVSTMFFTADSPESALAQAAGYIKKSRVTDITRAE